MKGPGGKLRLLVPLAVLAALGLLFYSLAGTHADDWTTPELCASCKGQPEDVIMPAVVAEWETSEHGNSLDEPGRDDNDYCAKCKSPFEANPESSYQSNNTVRADQWQGVTCAVCHPPYSAGIDGLGFYDATAGQWVDVAELPSMELCEKCHSGERHTPTFEGPGGEDMVGAGVTCFDCHLPDVKDAFADHRSHTLDPEDHVSESCGLLLDGCHSGESEAWAKWKIDSGSPHEKVTAPFTAMCYLGPQQSVEDAVATATGDLVAIYRLNADQSVDRWFPNRPELSTMTALSPYEAIFVVAGEEAVSWPQQATGSPPTSANLVQGWNSVCYSGQAKAMTEAAQGVTPGFAVAYSLASDQTWRRFVPGSPDLSNMATIGQFTPVLVLVTEDTGAIWTFDP